MERGLPMLSQLPVPMLNPSHGGMAATDMDGHTTVATTTTERDLPMPSLLPMPMLNLSHGGMAATDMDGHTTVATTITERGLPMLSLPLMLTPRLSRGIMLIMDGHTMATTGVELMGSIEQYSLTKAFTKDKHYENRTFNKVINFLREILHRILHV